MTNRSWVTGADGFIGRHLSDRLINSGHQTCGLGYRDMKPRSDELDWQDWQVGKIDIELLDALAERQALPNTIFHLAGGGSVGASYADPWLDFTATVVSVAAVIEWLRTRSPATRLVFISSAAIYGSGHQGPIAETDGGTPFSPYGAHKKIAEELCQAAGTNFNLDTIIVRPFSIYGPGIRKQLLWDCCTKLAANPEELTLGGTGEERRDWLHVSDLTNMLVKLAESTVVPGSILNAGTGRAHTVRDIVSLLGTAFGKTEMPINFSNVARTGDPASLIADVSSLRKLGIEAKHSIQDGILEYAYWYQSQ